MVGYAGGGRGRSDAMNFPPIEEQLSTIKRGVVDLVDEKEFVQRLEESQASNRPLT